MSAAEIAASTLGLSVEDIGGVERIKHGLTNESWLVLTARDPVVVRISRHAEDLFQIDRASEARILAGVAKAGIGAEILFSDAAQGILITRYLGPTWTHEDALHTHNIVRIAELLWRLHRLVPPAGVRTVDLLGTMEGYLETLKKHGAAPALITTGRQCGARDSALALRANATQCLCHNDVHHLNVIDDGELRLIDWEYAGIGEPFFDLASVCVYHSYDKSQREELLRAYEPNFDRGKTLRLEHACTLFEYIRDLWLAVRRECVSP